MFLLDSLMISGIQWALKTVVTAAEAEMNDDSALRDRLLEAEMQREMGEISDEEFTAIETDVLQAIREIKERREGGSGAFAFGPAEPIEAGADTRFQIEAELAGEFYGGEERSDRSVGAGQAAEPAAIPRTPRTRKPRTRTARTRMARTRTPRTARPIRTPKSRPK